ncbi:MAG: hypothetical protein GTN89_00585 [Acidobacteria bacterium]|nr:hypothetical protein [Acidobacteriota bacterium]NIM60282.1 hypothetical protein [Acidobacteriota bacterium]NIO57885.1 hypothetical protein [Acidobacteriota bacterium]NIQ28894.1 hypothetical protein [Acidobacteriota bacterium]NIQ83352.1 hypothetical protein [Acidobacteriota bacterium]
MQVPRTWFALGILILWAATAVLGDVRLSSGDAAVLAQVELPDGVTAIALSPDGRRLAYAVPSTKEGFADLVRLEAGTESAGSVSIPGTVRDLVFLDEGPTVVGLHHRPAKKRQGDTFLFSWGDEPKINRIMRVPPSSSDLDRWPGGGALLLACRNEIRTFLPPDFRSGPLFSLPGDNFAVSSLGNSTYVVVGQEEGLALLDLSVPSGRLSMTILAGLRTPARVTALADDAEGDEVLVRLVDGRLFRASFDPPGVQPAGTADHIAGLAKAASGPILPFAQAARQAQPASEPEEPDVIVTEIHDEPVIEPEPPPVEPAPEPERQPETPLDEPTPEPEQEPDAPADEPRAEPGPATPTRQLEGRIVGRLELVEAVVLLGPDNILREAARIRPAADGSWAVDDLTPGRYRIQLDGGGDRVLVAEPRFLMVDVSETPARAPQIRAVRSF